MPFRSDVTVDLSTSPRIITVAAPSAEITIQDLHDTLRAIEAYRHSIDYPPLISSAGKQTIDVGEQVGITATLLDAKLAFEARGAPPWVQCKVKGGNLVAVDSAGDPMDPFETTAFTQIVYRGSTSATLIAGSGGVSEPDMLAIADRVWDELLADHGGLGTIAQVLDAMQKKINKIGKSV